MALTDTFVKNVKHSGAASGDKYTDGRAMYLLVNAVGKYWRMNYRFADKRKTLALGVYPDVGLAKARARRDKAREQLADGIDPATAKREEKQACRRRLNIEPPCRFNIEPGRVANFWISNCG